MCCILERDYNALSQGVRSHEEELRAANGQDGDRLRGGVVGELCLGQESKVNRGLTND